MDFEDIKLPFVRRILPTTIGQSIKPFDPNNQVHVKEWREIFKKMFEGIQADFDAKGMPMPKIVFDHSQEPITYAIKTVDKDGNIIHSVPHKKDMTT